MTKEQATLNQVRAIVEQLPEPDRRDVKRFAAGLRDLLRGKHGAVTQVAIALVGAEIAAKE